MMLGVFGMLNGQYLMAQAQYHFNKPAAVKQVSTTRTASAAPASTAIDPALPPTLSIPSIGVSAPLVLDEQSYVDWRVQIALRKGVVHYGQTAMPGGKGNMVLLGHSSGQLWAPGDYKFVFTLLDKLKPNDTLTIDFQGTRYTYQVTDSQVVAPDDLSVLEQTTTPTLSLITCTPVGTSKSRLVVHAKQISPVPATEQTATAPKIAAPVASAELPGTDTSTSLWQRIRDLF